VNPIQPVHLHVRGAAVANLHAGLLFLVRNQPGISDNDRRILEQGLASELHEQTYKEWTAHLVSLYQEQLADRFKLVVNGDVDQATATALNSVLAELGAPGIGKPPQPPLYKECQKLLETVRERCPGLLPPEPLKAGAAIAPIPVQPQEAASLITLAVRQGVLEATGARVPADPKQLPTSVLWQEGPDALLVEVAGIKVKFAAGVISVAIPVRSDELPRTRDTVEVDLVFGTPDRPTGLLAAATEPRGARAVVRRWGEALTALAWQAVLNSIGGVAAAAGVDRDGAPLIPTALTVTSSGIAVLGQARHEMDRMRRGQVILGSSSPGVRRS
jgi:hypothetical protein